MGVCEGPAWQAGMRTLQPLLARIFAHQDWKQHVAYAQERGCVHGQPSVMQLHAYIPDSLVKAIIFAINYEIGFTINFQWVKVQTMNVRCHTSKKLMACYFDNCICYQNCNCDMVLRDDTVLVPCETFMGNVGNAALVEYSNNWNLPSVQRSLPL